MLYLAGQFASDHPIHCSACHFKLLRVLTYLAYSDAVLGIELHVNVVLIVSLKWSILIDIVVVPASAEKFIVFLDCD